MLHAHRAHMRHLPQQQHNPTTFRSLPGVCSYSKPFRPSGTSTRSITTCAYKLKPANGSEIAVSQVKYLVGSSPSADLKVQGAEVAAEHAELQQNGKQVFLKALQGEFVFDRSYTWIDDDEARPNVSYVLASGSRLSFGNQQQLFLVEFEEPSGANPLVEMMMKGMAASAGPEVQQELSQ